MAESDKCPSCGADQTSKSGELYGWLCGSEGWSKQVRTESVECLRNQLQSARVEALRYHQSLVHYADRDNWMGRTWIGEGNGYDIAESVLSATSEDTDV